MSIEHTLTADEPVLLADREGTHLHFLNNAATIKVAADGRRSMSVVEFLAPRGFGPPLHNHLEEDELFVVLEGTIALFSGDVRFEAEQGGIAYLPHGEPHTFQVLTDTARIVNVTSSHAAAPRFDQMVAALGVGTDRPALPEPGPIDPGRVADVCRAHGIEILGPPPAPLV
jgi:mannose-6-phosphate isomerase-like protein (cupin superfamily)